jgi:hypothetical protein
MKEVTLAAPDPGSETFPVVSRRFYRPENTDKTVFLAGTIGEKAATLWEMVLSRGLGRIYEEK